MSIEISILDLGALGQLIVLANYVIIPCLTIRLILINSQRKRLIYVITRDIPLILLVSITIFSLFWSASPLITFDYLKRLLLNTLFGVYLATRYNPREQMYILTWMIAIAAVLSLLGGLTFNQTEFWRGVYTYKQTLGTGMAVGAIAFLLTTFDSRRYRWITLAGFFLTVVLLLLSRSKLALSGFLISMSLMPIYKLVKQHYKLRTFLFTIMLILGLLATILVFNNLETIVVDGMGKNLEFNGRTPIWQNAIEQGLKRPWLGYGYHGFWTSPEGVEAMKGTWLFDIYSKVRVTTGTSFKPIAHNGFIDIFLQLGLLGLSVIIISCLIFFFRVFYLIFKTKKIEYFWMFQMLVLALFIQVGEGSIIPGLTNLWIFYVSMSLSSAVEYRHLKKINALNKSTQKIQVISLH
ncbi:O-antigen ligase family protein [Calothrix rhizosoleniae]|uniref:O-antigen ligase family protein n=1 Tax=Calothrix rhizosoleniae TaxID=888997 RepID=UPI0011775C29|nr:O-antigen ligase family protein [Calothrix rhizosoleniae]